MEQTIFSSQTLPFKFGIILDCDVYGVSSKAVISGVHSAEIAVFERQTPAPWSQRSTPISSPSATTALLQTLMCRSLEGITLAELGKSLLLHRDAGSRMPHPSQLQSESGWYTSNFLSPLQNTQSKLQSIELRSRIPDILNESVVTSQIFPTSPQPYDSVRVLMVHWDIDDPNHNLQPEFDAL